MSRALSPSFPSLHLRHSPFSNPFLTLPTSQLTLQPFCCFTYITVHSPTLLSLLLRHRIFTYVIWQAVHGQSAMPAWSLVHRSSSYMAKEVSGDILTLSMHDNENNKISMKITKTASTLRPVANSLCVLGVRRTSNAKRNVKL